MSTYSTAQLLESLNWRYAVKRFDASKKISNQDWKSLTETLMLTPSSYGLQPWKFLIVQNTELRKKLREASWGQAQVEDCSHYVVFLAKTSIDRAFIVKYAERMAELRSVPFENFAKFVDIVEGDVVKGPRAKVAAEWMARQTYIALGNFMTSAATLKIDTCPMEGLDPIKYDEILGLNGSGFHTIMACAAGYRSAEDKYQGFKKVRFPEKDLIEIR